MITTPGYSISRNPDGSTVYGPDRVIQCRTLLHCDDCLKPVAWVYDNDINGSYFQCFDCKVKDIKNATTS